MFCCNSSPREQHWWALHVEDCWQTSTQGDGGSRISMEERVWKRRWWQNGGKREFVDGEKRGLREIGQQWERRRISNINSNGGGKGSGQDGGKDESYGKFVTYCSMWDLVVWNWTSKKWCTLDGSIIRVDCNSKTSFTSPIMVNEVGGKKLAIGGSSPKLLRMWKEEGINMSSCETPYIINFFQMYISHNQ